LSIVQGARWEQGVAMVIESKQQRSFLTTVILGLIPDLLIAWAAASYFDGGLVGFIAAIVAFQCVYLVIWFKTFVWGWLLFWLSGRKKMTQGIEDALYRGRYPQPPEFIGSVEDYLVSVTNDAQVHALVRVKAASDLGMMAGLKLGARYSLGIQLNMAYEDALQAYARRFPPRQDESY
jgi:hypothetical protein